MVCFECHNIFVYCMVRSITFHRRNWQYKQRCAKLVDLKLVWRYKKPFWTQKKNEVSNAWSIRLVVIVFFTLLEPLTLFFLFSSCTPTFQLQSFATFRAATNKRPNKQKIGSWNRGNWAVLFQTTWIEITQTTSKTTIPLTWTASEGSDTNSRTSRNF